MKKTRRAKKDALKPLQNEALRQTSTGDEKRYQQVLQDAANAFNNYGSIDFNDIVITSGRALENSPSPPRGRESIDSMKQRLVDRARQRIQSRTADRPAMNHVFQLEESELVHESYMPENRPVTWTLLRKSLNEPPVVQPVREQDEMSLDLQSEYEQAPPGKMESQSEAPSIRSDNDTVVLEQETQNTLENEFITTEDIQELVMMEDQSSGVTSDPPALDTTQELAQASIFDNPRIQEQVSPQNMSWSSSQIKSPRAELVYTATDDDDQQHSRNTDPIYIVTDENEHQFTSNTVQTEELLDTTPDERYEGQNANKIALNKPEYDPSNDPNHASIFDTSPKAISSCSSQQIPPSTSQYTATEEEEQYITPDQRFESPRISFDAPGIRTEEPAIRIEDQEFEIENEIKQAPIVRLNPKSQISPLNRSPPRTRQISSFDNQSPLREQVASPIANISSCSSQLVPPSDYFEQTATEEDEQLLTASEVDQQYFVAEEDTISATSSVQTSELLSERMIPEPTPLFLAAPTPTPPQKSASMATIPTMLSASSSDQHLSSGSMNKLISQKASEGTSSGEAFQDPLNSKRGFSPEKFNAPPPQESPIAPPSPRKYEDLQREYQSLRSEFQAYRQEHPGKLQKLQDRLASAKYEFEQEKKKGILAKRRAKSGNTSGFRVEKLQSQLNKVNSQIDEFRPTYQQLLQKLSDLAVTVQQGSSEKIAQLKEQYKKNQIDIKAKEAAYIAKIQSLKRGNTENEEESPANSSILLALQELRDRVAVIEEETMKIKSN